jgi:hypothetical protein
MLTVAISSFFAIWQHGTWSQAWHALKSQTFLTAIFLSGTLGGLVINAVSTPLYRLLEGYSWPDFARQWGIRRQLRIKKGLEDRVGKLTGWRRQIVQERLGRFPDDAQQTLPSSLGNAFRAFETYARSRYGMDSQLLWSELTSVASQSLQNDLADARTGIDLFVATAYVSVIAGTTIFWLGLFAGWSLVPLFLFAGISLLVAWVCYRLAVIATDGLAQAVQAMVRAASGVDGDSHTAARSLACSAS